MGRKLDIEGLSERNDDKGQGIVDDSSRGAEVQTLCTAFSCYINVLSLLD